MRISGEERREKRENLRHTVNDTLGSLSLQQRLAAITMTEHGSWLGVMRGLADLIDRPTTHNLSEPPGFACELCDEYAPGNPLRMAMREYWRKEEADGC